MSPASISKGKDLVTMEKEFYPLSSRWCSPEPIHQTVYFRPSRLATERSSIHPRLAGRAFFILHRYMGRRPVQCLWWSSLYGRICVFPPQVSVLSQTSLEPLIRVQTRYEGYLPFPSPPRKWLMGAEVSLLCSLWSMQSSRYGSMAGRTIHTEQTGRGVVAVAKRKIDQGSELGLTVFFR